ncbi:Hypothetical protein PHPALM_37208 [Phytophthora palmivora]|uniref:ISXO2-like transposase domain-containing protein n=1 Tax=Phytophthora palmivora TaxID=4796 RepID=A0A2P4WXZ6_9STRA|nr:Hypothetical protein PHPALM_37208 [Phytophthora palmivora]
MDCPTAYHYAPAEDGAFDSKTILPSATTKIAASTGLLEQPLLCPKCSQPMHLYLSTKRWRCTRWKAHADGQQKEISIYATSFFTGMKLKAGEAVRLLHAWSMRLPQTKAGELAGVRPGAVSDWYAYCRTARSKELVSTNCQIGGEGHTVEIDETSMAKKQKYHRGRAYQAYWLFGGVNRSTGQWFGTPIMSDMYASYVCERGGKLHTLENNRYLTKNFVDSVTDAHTNTIEGLREIHMKRHINYMRGMKKEDLDAYIDEFMWRSWFFPPR